MAEKSIAALWDKEGKDYKTGILDLDTLPLGATGKIKIIMFPNDRKEGSQPDHRIFISKPRNDEQVDPF